jgi:hypothetical protein
MLQRKAIRQLLLIMFYKFLFSINYDNLFLSELEKLYFAESQEGKIMPNTYPPDLQTAWAHVVARAWKDPEFFKLLTQDPKAALESEPENPHHHTILSHGGAVLPLPPLSARLQNSSVEDLVALADQEGFFGILRFT